MYMLLSRNRLAVSLPILLMLTGWLPFVAAPASAGETLIELGDIRADEILMIGFTLPRDAELTFEALGLRSGNSSKLIAYAWLLDHETREPVWIMDRRHRDRDRTRGERVLVEQTVRVEAGKYELYFTALGSWSSGLWDGDWDDLGDLFRNWTGHKSDRKSDRNYERELRQCYVNVLSEDLTRHEIETFEVTGEIPDALLQMNAMGDDEYVKKGFELKRDTRLRVYALAEIPSKTAMDRAWIVNADTHERVWETTHRNTDPAGGGSKNRYFDDEVEFAAGRYILYYATDDSHSWEYFNTRPPFDPINWGVSLLPGRDYRQGAFATYDPPERSDALVDLTRARDDDYLEQPFKITRETSLHVRGLGEYSDWSDEFVDYGGIQDMSTGQLAWDMTGRNTVHAGGAEKNRIFEGTLKLSPGKYVAFYTTDGSHSYRDWNSGAPYEPDAWGLTLYPGPDYRKGDLEKLTDRDVAGDDILARIVRVRDDEHRRERFTLDAETRVHIYAMGEGDDGRMYDYARIEDHGTGRSVWEMTYRKTRHAGGADKNRVFDGEIVLDAGTYEVFYESDGSHSFHDWNAAKPRNPQMWGVTVSVADKES